MKADVTTMTEIVVVGKGTEGLETDLQTIGTETGNWTGVETDHVTAGISEMR